MGGGGYVEGLDADCCGGKRKLTKEQRAEIRRMNKLRAKFNQIHAALAEAAILSEGNTSSAEVMFRGVKVAAKAYADLVQQEGYNAYALKLDDRVKV